MARERAAAAGCTRPAAHLTCLQNALGSIQIRPAFLRALMSVNIKGPDLGAMSRSCADLPLLCPICTLAFFAQRPSLSVFVRVLGYPVPNQPPSCQRLRDRFTKPFLGTDESKENAKHRPKTFSACSEAPSMPSSLCAFLTDRRPDFVGVSSGRG